MAKSQGRCIFCCGEGLSKEHIFGNWLKAIFRRGAARNWFNAWDHCMAGREFSDRPADHRAKHPTRAFRDQKGARRMQEMQ